MPTANSEQVPLALLRVIYFGPVAAIVGGSALLAAAAGEGLAGPARWLLVGLIGFNALWLALAAWQVVIGFFLHCLGARGRSRLGHQLAGITPSSPVASRTAVLLTIHNEEPHAVFARVRIMAEALAAGPDRSAVDMFVLSDTRDPDIAAVEEAAFDRLLAAGPAIPTHYRRRTRNTGRKAGNVADFCVRHGERYEHMILLDADSLMTARTMGLLIRLMEANPGTALIQTVTHQVNLETLFARIHQFSARLYVPLSMLGLSFWQAGQGNYWGHNAIVRVRAYLDHCELPVLPGRPPLGGEILCHDTVEAALLHRAGWAVHLVPELDGSFEEMPANFIDQAGRSRRWCQGNLQHVRLLCAPGLPWVSRAHLAIGIGTYAAAPAWLAIGVLALAAWLPTGGPAPAEAAAAGTLTLVMLGMIVLPKLLSLAAVLGDPAERRRFGGAGRLLASASLEQLHASVTWPARMVLYAYFVGTTLLGRVVRWDAQPRGNRAVGYGEAFRRLRGLVLLGGALAASTLYAAPPLAIWFAPGIFGLMLSPVLAAWTSRVSLGRGARRLGLALTPDETEPAAELASLRDDLASPSERWRRPGHAVHEDQPYMRPTDAARAEA